MRFQLTRNGTSPDSLKRQFEQMHKLSAELIEHMNLMDHTHGRNYQTVGEGDAVQAIDAMRFRALQSEVRALMQYARAGYNLVCKQEGEGF